MILEWRNSSEIKKQMLNQENILLENHLKFIESLKTKNNVFWFLVKENNECLGVINFKQNEIGLYKNPDKQKVGSILMKSLVDYGFNVLKFDKLVLYVFETNLKAINLYKKFGFKPTDKKDNLIKMELYK